MQLIVDPSCDVLGWSLFLLSTKLRTRHRGFLTPNSTVSQSTFILFWGVYKETPRFKRRKKMRFNPIKQLVLGLPFDF